MFGFLLRKKRDDVQRLLARRMNRGHLRSVHQSRRSDSRGSANIVVWAVPIDERSGQPNLSRAFAAVTHDISSNGLSIIHTRPALEEELIVGWPEPNDVHFLRCATAHSEPLGCGFYQIGLRATEIVQLPPSQFGQLAAWFVKHELPELDTQDESTRSTNIVNPDAACCQR